MAGTKALLVLQAPYYNMTDLVHREFPFIPGFILKYTFMTNEHIKACKMPIVFFHGDRDNVIPYASALELKKEAKPGDKLITLHGWGHNGFTDSPEYIEAMRGLLE